MGARISLMAGFSLGGWWAASSVRRFGLLAGYYEGWWDRIVMRISDVLFAFPGHPAGARRGRHPRQQHGQRDRGGVGVQRAGVRAAGARQHAGVEAR
jgi:hypothetical protein